MIHRPDAASARSLLFVYGTLRRGFELHHHLVRLGAKCRGRGKVAGELFDRGRYPGGRASLRKGTWIRGEMYELPTPEYDFRVLDRIEGFNPCAPVPREFARELTIVSMESRETRRAWIYWLNRPVPRGRRIASGDYLNRRL